MINYPNHTESLFGHCSMSPMLEARILAMDDWEVWTDSPAGPDDGEPADGSHDGLPVSVEDEFTQELVGVYDEEHGGPARVVPGDEFFLRAEDAAVARMLHRELRKLGGTRRRLRM